MVTWRPFNNFLSLLLLLVFLLLFFVVGIHIVLKTCKDRSSFYLIWTLKSLHSLVVDVCFIWPSFQERIFVVVMMVQLAMSVMGSCRVRHINQLQVIIVVFAITQIILLLRVIEEFSHRILVLLLVCAFLSSLLLLLVLFASHTFSNILNYCQFVT